MHHPELGFASRAAIHVLRTRCRATINEEAAATSCLTDMPILKLAKAPPSPACAGKGLRRIDSKLDMIGLCTSSSSIPPTNKDLSTPAASPPASCTIIDNDIAYKQNVKSMSTIHSVHVGLSIDIIRGSSKELSPQSIAEVACIPENLFISHVFESTDAQPFQLQPRPSSN